MSNPSPTQPAADFRISSAGPATPAKTQDQAAKPAGTPGSAPAKSPEPTPTTKTTSSSGDTGAAKPVEATSKPAVEVTGRFATVEAAERTAPAINPSNAPAKPAEAIQPVEDTAKPARSAKPTDSADKPIQTIAKPTDSAGKSSDATARPTDSAAKSSEVTAKPTDRAAKPSEATAMLTDSVTMPAEKPTERSHDTAKPAEGTTKPATATATRGITPGDPHHIAEQRVVDDRPSTSEPTPRSDKPQLPATETKQRSVPSARLSGYQAEAAKLLAGAMPNRRKRRAAADKASTDPVAEDQAGKASRPAKKGHSRPSTKG
jgi:hypothetical protein